MNTVILLTVIGIILCIPCILKKNDSKIYLLFFIVFFFIDQLLIGKFYFPELPTIGTEWNWTGKIASALFSLIVILIFRKRFQIDFAFTLKQRTGSLKPTLITVGILVTIGVIVIWLFSSKVSPTLETHLFQLTMPGIAEELAFRGVFLGLLNNVFTKSRRILGAEIGWGVVVTSLLFGFCHGIGFDNTSNLYFNIEPILMALIAGFLLAWLREKTGSLLIPVLFHNLINELGNIIRIFN